MTAKDPLLDLQLLIKSRHAIVVVETPEPERAETLLRRLSGRLGLPFFVWTQTRGLRRDGGEGAVYNTTDPGAALAHIAASRRPALYYFEGLSDFLEDRAIAARLKDAAEPFSRSPGAILLAGPAVRLPEAVHGMAAVLPLPRPTRAEYRDLLQSVLKDLAARMPVRVSMQSEDFARLLNHLQGLTLQEAERILARAVVEDGKLTPEDIASVVAAKKSLVEREGVLEYFPAEERMGEVAGLAGLKDWLAERRSILTDPARAARFGLAFPKGILLLGVPGCGKSLCAKAVAGDWGLPLLKLDPGRLYDKYVGESEKNFRRALSLAERMAPAVLWIDELEKAFSPSTGEGDGGLTSRIFGTFLSWLQDRRGEVFVVATANDVSRLPPEFLRKGRFDEIFFIDLPDPAARTALFTLHLRRRGQDPSRFDLPRLVAATEGFGGSEVEQAIVAGLYAAFSGRIALTTEILQGEIGRTRPLARTMGEKIEWLREWARERARPAA